MSGPIPSCGVRSRYFFTFWKCCYNCYQWTILVRLWRGCWLYWVGGCFADFDCAAEAHWSAAGCWHSRISKFDLCAYAQIWSLQLSWVLPPRLQKAGMCCFNSPCPDGCAIHSTLDFCCFYVVIKPRKAFLKCLFQIEERCFAELYQKAHSAKRITKPKWCLDLFETWAQSIACLNLVWVDASLLATVEWLSCLDTLSRRRVEWS